MNLDNIQYCDLPFKHWEFKNCTDDLTLKEISNCSIPNGERAYDGTRAADHTGHGKDGKPSRRSALHAPDGTRTSPARFQDPSSRSIRVPIRIPNRYARRGAAASPVSRIRTTSPKSS